VAVVRHTVTQQTATVAQVVAVMVLMVLLLLRQERQHREQPILAVAVAVLRTTQQQSAVQVGQALSFCGMQHRQAQ
jgi:hypothetical protein